MYTAQPLLLLLLYVAYLFLTLHVNKLVTGGSYEQLKNAAWLRASGRKRQETLMERCQDCYVLVLHRGLQYCGC